MEEEKINSKKQKKSSWFRWVVRLLILIIILPFLIALLLQIPVIQNWAVDKLASYFSDKMETTVSIGSVDFSVFDGLELDDFYVEDTEGDTLLFSKNFEVGLQKSLVSIFSRELSLDGITLTDGYIHIITYPGSSISNLELLLSKFGGSNESTGPAQKPYILNLNKVSLENFTYKMSNLNKGSSQEFKMKSGVVDFDEISLQNKFIKIKSIYLEQPKVKLVQLNQEILFIQDDSTGQIKEVIVKSEVPEGAQPFNLLVGTLEMVNGALIRTDESKSRNGLFPQSFDAADMDLSDLNLKVRELHFKSDKQLFAIIDFLKLKDKRGFEIDQLSADTLAVDSESILFSNFKLKTDHTDFQNDLEITYNDFSDFGQLTDRVFFKADFDNAKIGLNDLTYFIKDLNKNDFFNNNRKRSITLNGKYFGRINKLSGRNVAIYFDDGLQLEGTFDSRNITDSKNALVNIKIEKLQTNIDFLEQVIPGFTTPANFEKVGDFTFKGRFDGYFKDFVAFGKLQSALGTADLDMRLDVKNGARDAKYSGAIAISDFDLNRWSDDDDFGKVNFKANVTNGSGLTFETVFADLNASVQSLDFRGYTYADFNLDGQLRKNKFEGVFKINDNNANFEFDGNIELIDGRPYMNFEAAIAQLDLKKLNLIDESITFKGNIDVNMNGKGIDDMVGNIVASNLNIVRNDSLYVIDTISFVSNSLNNGRQSLELYSDIGKAKITGLYNYKSVVNSVKKIIKDNYPYYTAQWPEIKNIGQQDFDFDIHLFDSKNILSLAGISDLAIQDFKAKGKISNINNEIAITSSIPFVAYKQYQVYGGQLNINSINADGALFVTLDSSVVGDRSFNPIDISSHIKGDSIHLNISTDDLIDSIQRLDIGALITPDENGIKLHLQDNELIMLGNKWSFSENNSIIFGEKYIDISSLSLSDRSKLISVNDIDKEGLEVVLSNVDLAMANPIINYDKMLFGGDTDVSLKIYKIFSDAPVVTGNVSIDNLLINNDDFGHLEIDVSKTNENPYEGLFSLVSPDHSLKSNLVYDPDTKNLNASIKGRDLPMRIFEFIINEGISETVGKADLDVTLAGPISNLDLMGDAMLKEGAVKVDYLGAKFFFDQQPLKITKYFLDLTDDIITDTEGNVGIITGGIRHELFSEFNMDLNISADNAIVLNTQKADNPLYYGYAQGNISVDFDGPFDRANLIVNAITGPNTVLNLPVSYYQDGFDESFVKFVDRDNLDDQEITIINSNDNYKIKGLNIEMNVTLNQDAQMRIIFDEARRDIMEGRGNGNIQMNIDRYGAFDVYGEYQVVSGNYLFTVGPLVRKPFRIKPGGLIRWQGDPLNASLNIQADYSVRTPLNVFLAEYLSSPNAPVTQEAQNRQVTELTLDLTGTIFKPKVNFGIAFPQLQGELKTYADSKLRTLSTNEIALNSQVMGLIVSNSFLPTTGGLGSVGTNDFIESAGINTLSELLSNQLSNFLTGLLTEALSDNGLISGIDFKVGFRNNAGLIAQSANAIDINEVEFNMANRFAFLNERLSLNVGGNFVRNDQFAGVTGNYVAGNLVLEYFLTDERKLKLRLYGTSDIDFQEQQRRGKYGFGIGYRTQFGTLSEFQDGFADAIKQVIDNQDK